MDRNDKRRRSAIFILFGLWILWGFGWNTVEERLRIEIDGIIVASRDVPSAGAPRYATEYTVRFADGRERVYWAGATDASLPRGMPVGTHIRKERWHLDYERDGRTEGFPYIFYSITLGIALGSLVWGIVKLLPERKLPQVR
jgi:hypothetical protein